ncbi:MAG: pyridoxal 5'-phosphate synthase glutaminase subunit PdxT [Desulfobacteraceae bacterium]|nr:pyridoxal 5'-phosphate synthase glutaminase subunit PdxT [Desulfobacteraceae bacterium]
MIAGLLGLQGAFLDHIRHLESSGAAWRIVKAASDLKLIDRLIIPGGESSVMKKFLDEFDMVGPLSRQIAAGMPTWGVCAGAVILSEGVDGAPGVLRAIPMAVRRNAYGRHAASGTHGLRIPLFKRRRFPATFIRAPRILVLDPSAAVHCRWHGDPVFVQYRRVMVTTFHPELGEDNVFHQYFLKI